MHFLNKPLYLWKKKVNYSIWINEKERIFVSLFLAVGVSRQLHVAEEGLIVNG